MFSKCVSLDFLLVELEQTNPLAFQLAMENCGREFGSEEEGGKALLFIGAPPIRAESILEQLRNSHLVEAQLGRAKVTIGLKLDLNVAPAGCEDSGHTLEVVGDLTWSGA